MPNEYAIASSGDEDEDRKALADFIVRDHLIKRGQCPNGCGGMKEVDPYNAICLKCEFMYFAGGGLNFELGEEQ